MYEEEIQNYSSLDDDSDDDSEACLDPEIGALVIDFVAGRLCSEKKSIFNAHLLLCMGCQDDVHNLVFIKQVFYNEKAKVKTHVH